MIYKEVVEKLSELVTKRQTQLDRLIPAARAAANQLKDAKMDRAAAALDEVLFQLDANTQELTEFTRRERAVMLDFLLGRDGKG